MALRFVDGFDSYTSTSGGDLTSKWSEIENGTSYIQWDSTGGLSGGGALYVRDSLSSSDSIQHTFIPAGDETSNNQICIGMWVRSELANTGTFYIYLGAASSSEGALRINAAGTSMNIGFYGSPLSSSDSVSGVIVGDQQWHWIEARITFSNTGSWELYVDGILVYQNLSVDLLSSGTGAVGYIGFEGATNNNSDWWIDDLIVYDDVVGTLAGDLRSSVDFPVGPLKIETSRPDSTGANQDFTGVGGSTTTNYLNVDESPLNDGDSSYNGTDTSTGAVDTFGYASLASTGITSIVGTVANNVGRKDGLGNIALRGVAISSASTANEDASQLGGGYLTYQSHFVYDPATSTRWTTAGLDAAEFGYATSSST